MPQTRLAFTPRTIWGPMRRLLAAMSVVVLSVAVALPVTASHGQDSDTDSAWCPSTPYSTLKGSGYAHEWQDHNHDGAWWNPANYSGWKWKTKYWGIHTGTQYISVVGGGPSVTMNATCPDAGIE